MNASCLHPAPTTVPTPWAVTSVPVTRVILSMVMHAMVCVMICRRMIPDSKLHGANMGPTRGPSGADRTKVGLMLAP